jgi:hypothetical protein
VTLSGPTPFVELNTMVLDVVDRARVALGGDLIGAYLVGSFALGDADEHSDCDLLIVVADRPDAARERALRALHAEIPDWASDWSDRIECGYAPAADLAMAAPAGTDPAWLYVRRGYREMEWTPSWNKPVIRRVLREHGAVVAGPPPRGLVAPVPDHAVRAQMRRDLPALLEEVADWGWPFRLAWAQRYLVATYCRMLFSLATDEVASKPAALRWARRHLHPRWAPLLTQVLDDRERGLDLADPSRPGSVKASLRFSAYALALLDRDPGEWSVWPGDEQPLATGWLRRPGDPPA